MLKKGSARPQLMPSLIHNMAELRPRLLYYVYYGSGIARLAVIPRIPNSMLIDITVFFYLYIQKQ